MAVEIVLSTAWRKSGTKKDFLLNTVLKGMKVRGSIPDTYERDRGKQIKDWLTEHGSNVVGFCVIDDSFEK